MKVVRVLMEFGADPSQGDPPPIISAITRERKDMFLELVEHGAKFLGDIGVAAVHGAMKEGLESMLALLEEHGVNIQE